MKFHSASKALGASVKAVKSWTEAVQVPAHQSGASSLISAEWFRQLIRNDGTSIPKSSLGLILPAEIASGFGLPEDVAVHLVSRGLIRTKRIHGVFDYRLRSARAANPEEVAAYLAKRKITFDLLKTPLVSEREIHKITGIGRTPIRSWLALVTLRGASRLAGVSVHVAKHWVKSKILGSQLAVVNGRPLRFVSISDLRALLQSKRSKNGLTADRFSGGRVRPAELCVLPLDTIVPAPHYWLLFHVRRAILHPLARSCTKTSTSVQSSKSPRTSRFSAPVGLEPALSKKAW